MRDRKRNWMVVTAILSACSAGLALAADTPTPAEGPQAKAPAASAPSAGDETSDIVRMTKDYELWVDRKQKKVILGGQVCLREGQLEMFACPKGTKEHESIVSVNCKEARLIHAALLAVGAQPGKPVSFDPVYRPASGSIVDVFLVWQDEAGKKNRVRAQEWIKELKSDKPMSHPWVFAGSGFWKDDTTGQQYYQADGGDLICVSNFPSAMLDLPIESTQANSELLFSAFTERIPPLGTRVRLELIPRLEPKKEPARADTQQPVGQPAPK